MHSILLPTINNFVVENTGEAKPAPTTEPQSVWADSNIVLSTIKRRLITLPQAKLDDPFLRLGSWNMEYMWQAKAKYFLAVYQEIVSRHHLLVVQEVTERGIAAIATACDYNFRISQPNSRGQAVGFLIHPRFKIEKTYEYPQLLNVFGIHDLRPALQVNLLDCRSQLALSVINIHLKSMRGGITFTSRVRKQQLQQLLVELHSHDDSTVIAGDFNCFLDTADDIDCLLSDGYKLVNPHNHTSTQSGGGRLDGLFCKNLPPGLKLSSYNIRNFWRSSLAGRSLSDHGLLTWKMTLGV